MRPKTIMLALVAGLLLIAGAAAAERNSTDNSTEPEDGGQAWVDDCPPDMMCAASDGSQDESDENISYGDDDCAHCSGMSDESDGEAEPACEADCPKHAPEGEEPDCGERECQYSPRAGDGDESGGDAEPACEADCPKHAPEGEEPDCGERECQYSPRTGDGNASSGDEVEPVPEPQGGDEPTYSGDCGGEVCAYDENPDEPVSSDNCMDGADAGEACDGNRTYLGAPDDGRESDVSEDPSDAGSASDNGRVGGDDVRQNTPGVGLVAVLGVLGTVLAILAPRRRG